MPLEGLWWADDMKEFNIEDKGSWNWTAMIMQPEFITEELIKKAIADVEDKKNPFQYPRSGLKDLVKDYRHR